MVATDGQLLDSFLRRNEASAFETLMDRHGPMVLSVCQRVLRDRHAADDAFQATFLVLARNGGSVRRPDAVGSWLYAVAYRIALRLRTNRQHALDKPAGEMPDVVQPHADPVAAVVWRELRPILDEEISRLPEKYRSPVVLCHLQGKSNSEAARALGWPVTSLTSRLSRAEELLRGRLTGRGVALSSGMLLAALAGEGRAAVPLSLVQPIARTATLLAAGQAAVADGVSEPAAALADGMVRTMLLGKLKVAAASLLLLVALGTGVGWLLGPATAARPSAAVEAAPLAEPAGAAAAPRRTDALGDPLPAGAVARIGTIRFRHHELITSVGFSPDGKSLVSGGFDGFIRVWDRATGKEITRFQGNRVVSGIAVAADGRTLATCGPDGVVRVWEIASGKEVTQLAGVSFSWGMPMVIAYSSDGKLLATAGEPRTVKDVPNPIRIWDAVTGKELRQVPGHKGQIRWLNFVPGSQLLASGTNSDGMIRLSDAGTGKQRWQVELGRGKAETATFTADGKSLACSTANYLGGDDGSGSIRLVDLATGKEIGEVGKEFGRSPAIAYLPDGKSLVCMSKDRRLCLWEATSGKEVRQFGEADGRVNSIAVSPDGKTLAAGIGRNAIRLWDIASGQELLPQAGHTESVAAFSVSGDGKRVAIGGQHGTIHVWELPTGKLLCQFRTPESILFSIAMSPDGKTIASSGQRGSILWDAATGKMLRQLTSEKTGVYKVAFSPDGKSLAASLFGNTIQLVNPTTGEKLRTIPDGPGTGLQMSSVVFSTDGKMLVTGGTTVALWDATSGKLVRTFRGDAAQQRGTILLSPDGRYLAVGGWDRIIRFWNGNTGNQVYAIDPTQLPGPPRDPLNPQVGDSPVLAYSPDGRMLASASRDGRIHLWETATGIERLRMEDNIAPVLALAFAPNGKQLISGHKDTTLLIWDVAGESQAERRPLSAQQAQACWTDLSSGDGRTAFRAMRALIANPDEATLILEKLLRPVVFDTRQIDKLVRELDSPQFEVRDRAAVELEKFGERSEPALRQLLANKPALELKQRAEALLEKVVTYQKPPPEQARALRAVEVLEYIGTTEAKRILKTLAEGTPGAGLTREAEAALARLGRAAVP